MLKHLFKTSKEMGKRRFVLFAMALLALASCSKDLDEGDILAFSSEKQILGFSFEQSSNASLLVDRVATINQENKTISVQVSQEVDITNLIPRIVISDAAVVAPTSGLEQNFTNPVTYTVTAEDKSTAQYTVTVSSLNSEKQITGFRFLGNENAAIAKDYIADIDQESKTIKVTLPFGTDVKTLKPVIDRSTETIISPESTSTQDFTNPVTYTLTAPDGSTVVYTVTVTLPQLSEREALIAMYKATSAENQQQMGWDLSAADMNSWIGVVAEGEEVVELSLNSNVSILLDEKVFNLINLRKLSLASSVNSSFPRELGTLNSLTELINRSAVGVMPDWIGDIKNLEVIRWVGNIGSPIPNGLYTLQKLRILDLENNGLLELPDNIGQLKLLEELYLSLNSLKEIPNTIKNIGTLKTLSITDNELVAFPNIEGLVNLEELDLGANSIISIPSTIGSLTNLKSLSIYTNQLSSLPPEIGNLSMLQDLTVSANSLVNLPKEIGQLTELRLLLLSNNKISEIPVEIGNLTKLRTLSVRNNNELKGLPLSIGQLINLESLSIDGNTISVLPSTIVELKALTTFRLDNNILTSLPTVIGDLTKLETLSVSNNLLTEIPAQIGKLIQLKQLSLTGNVGLVSIPQSVCDLENTGTIISKDTSVICK